MTDVNTRGCCGHIPRYLHSYTDPHIITYPYSINWTNIQDLCGHNVVFKEVCIHRHVKMTHAHQPVNSHICKKVSQ